MKKLCLAAIAMAVAIPVYGQDGASPESAIEIPEGVTSQMLQAGDISMEVWRAGEEGLPVVWVQDMHNYFTPQGEPTYSARFLARTQPEREFLARLGGNYRAYAPMRRGYGRTVDDGAYDVPTHGGDLIAMLDAEGIDKAVFLGRSPTQLDLLWLADNHPDRIAGLIFLEGDPQGLPDVSDPDMFAVGSAFWRGAKDISADNDKLDAATIKRVGSYNPEFLYDTQRQITVPTLILGDFPEMEGTWMWLAIFKQIQAQVKCSEVTEAFPCNIFGDAERTAKLEASLVAHPMNRLAAEARGLMEERFTDLTIDPFEMPSGPPETALTWETNYQRIEPFLKRLSEESAQALD